MVNVSLSVQTRSDEIKVDADGYGIAAVQSRAARYISLTEDSEGEVDSVINKAKNAAVFQ